MKSLFTRIAAGLLLCLVALLAGSATLRLFIHGREVAVPNLANMSDEDAAKAAKKLGLNLSVENRFYSAAVAPNHVLSQSPVAGSKVRRGWQVRVTESLGGQHVAIPDVSGQTERPAELVLRRLQLEIGNVAHLPAPTPGGIVLAQSPPANTTDLSGPRIGLLVADEEAPSSGVAFVMPPLVGLTMNAASLRLSSAGLHIASATDPSYVAPAAEPTADAMASMAGSIVGDPAIPPTVVPPPPVSGDAIISYQSPAVGHKVTRSDAIRVSVLPAVSLTVPDAVATPQ